jgi:hypothetical protein
MSGDPKKRRVASLPMEAVLAEHRNLTGNLKPRGTGGARGLALLTRIIEGVRDGCPDAKSYALTQRWNTRGPT